MVGKYSFAVGRFLGLIIGVPPAISFSRQLLANRSTRFNNVLIRISLARATVKRFSFTVSLRLFQSSRSPCSPELKRIVLFFFSVSNLSIMDSCRIRARTGYILTRLFFAMKVRNVSSFDTKLMATIPAFLERSPDSFQPPSLDRMILLSVAKSRPRLPYKTRISFFRLQNFFSPEFVQPNSIRIKPVRTSIVASKEQNRILEYWAIEKNPKDESKNESQTYNFQEKFPIISSVFLQQFEDQKKFLSLKLSPVASFPARTDIVFEPFTRAIIHRISAQLMRGRNPRSG